MLRFSAQFFNAKITLAPHDILLLHKANINTFMKKALPQVGEFTTGVI